MSVKQTCARWFYDCKEEEEEEAEEEEEKNEPLACWKCSSIFFPLKSFADDRPATFLWDQ